MIRSKIPGGAAEPLVSVDMATLYDTVPSWHVWVASPRVVFTPRTMQYDAICVQYDLAIIVALCSVTAS